MPVAPSASLSVPRSPPCLALGLNWPPARPRGPYAAARRRRAAPPALGPGVRGGVRGSGCSAAGTQSQNTPLTARSPVSRLSRPRSLPRAHVSRARESLSVYIPPVELASLPHDVATAWICTFDRTRTSLHRSAGSLLHQRPSRHAPHRDSHDADRINRPVVSVGARDSQPLHHVHAR